MNLHAQVCEPAPEGPASRRLVERFHAIYREALGVAFDLEEYRCDDLYAFRTLERALRSDAVLLVRLAAWLHAQRERTLERITIGPADVLRSSLRGDASSRASQFDGNAGLKANPASVSRRCGMSGAGG